jgi:hypothetical protein
MNWIKLFRKFKDWEWYQDNNTKSVFLELLLTANYENKRWQGIEIKRGQIITSIQSLLIALNKNPKYPDISIQNIRTALTRLKSTNELTIQTTSKYTLITINKYNDYQQLTNNLTNDQQTANKRLTTTKEYKNIKNTNTVGLRYLQKWNEVFGKNYVSTKAIERNLDYWLSSYKEKDVLEAIEGIKRDKYWGDKDLSPEWLLRTKEKGEPVDRIGRMLNNKVKSLIQKV